MNYLRKQITKIDVIISFLLAIIIVFAVAVGRKFHTEINITTQVMIGLLLGTVVFVVLVFRDRLIQKRYKYEKGLKGEDYLKNKIKNGLKDIHYHLLSNINNNHRGDIDFVLICEHGIYCIENKNINGRIWYDKNSRKLKVNNFSKNYIGQVQGNARYIRNKLIENGVKIDFVEPILVMNNYFLDKVPPKISNTKIFYADKFVEFINKQKAEEGNRLNIDSVLDILKKYDQKKNRR